jgi:hypothetical protein
MSYIGNPIVSTDFPKDTFSGNGSTTAFTMSIAPASVNAVIVAVSGIVQDPSTYTISGTTLTFSGAPPSGTSNISVRHLGVAGIPNTPSVGSVVPASLSTGGPSWDSSGNLTSTGSGTYANSLLVSKAHGSGSYPTITLKNSTAGTTYSGKFQFQDGNGNNGWNIGNNITTGSGYLEFNNGSTSSGYFDPSNNLAFNSGYGSAKIAYGCRAWVNFNGTNGTIRASGNVSSVTYNATGDYTVYFATTMVDSNYCPVFGGAMDWRTIGSAGTSDITTSYCRLYVRIPSNANMSNVDTVTLAIFR